MKERSCRNSACNDGECRYCRRERGQRRDERASHIRKLVADRGWTEELTTQANAIVCQSFAAEGMHDALERGGFDTASSASVQSYLETGEYIRHDGSNSEIVEWF